MIFEFRARLWLYQGDGAWVFATLPREISKDIELVTSGLQRKGFGSVRVTVVVNDIAWSTSIFPDSKLNAYLLPVRKDIRTKASISVGDMCNFRIQLDDIL